MLKAFSPTDETLNFFSKQGENGMTKQCDINEIQEQMNIIQEQNLKLASELKKTKENCDDLTYRLNLNNQILDDLKINKENEKREMEFKFQERIKNLKIDFENKNKEMNSQIEAYKSELNDKDGKLESSRNELKRVNASVNNILIASQFYFLKTFNNIDDLYNYIKDNQNKPKESNNEKQLNTSNNERINELKKKLKTLKNKNSELKAKNQESANKINELKKQNEKQKLEFSDKINKIELSLNSIQKQNLAAQQNYKFESEKRINGIQNLLDKEKEKTKTLLEKLEQKENLVSVSQNNSINKEKQLEYEKKLELNNKAKNLAFSKQLQDMNEKHKRKIAKISEENQKLKDENESLTKEYNLMKLQIEKLKEDCKNYNSQLQALEIKQKQINLSLNEEMLKNQKLNSSLEIMECSFEKQKEEIKIALEERNKFIMFVQEQEKIIRTLENSNSNLLDKVKNNKMIINEQKLELLKKEEENTNKEIPLSLCIHKDFPNELCNDISNICKSDMLPESCKFRKIIETICKYFSEIILSKENIIENNEREHKSFLKKIKNLMLSLSSLLQDDLISQESFLSESNFDKYISNHISSLVESKVLLTSDNNKLTNDIKSINRELKTNSVSETLTKISSLYSDISQLVNLINKLQLNKNKIKKSLISIQELREKEAKQSQYVISKQSAKIEKLKNENNNLIQKYQESIQQNSNIQSSFINKLTESENEKEGENTRLQSRIDQLQKEYIENINVKNNQIKDLITKNDRLKSKIFRFKQDSEIYKNSLDENKKTIEELENKMNSQNQQSNTDTRFVQIIGDFKKQNDELRNLLSNSTESLKGLEDKNQELILTNSKLSIENKKLQAKVNIQIEEMNRQSQILNTKYHALQLASSTKTQMEVDEAKAQFSNEKRKLIGYFIKNFSFMFDPNERLTEDNFKKWVQKYSIEIQKLIKLEQTIRRLLGIGKNDSIEQSIIKLISC